MKNTAWVIRDKESGEYLIRFVGNEAWFGRKASPTLFALSIAEMIIKDFKAKPCSYDDDKFSCSTADLEVVKIEWQVKEG